MTGHCTSSYLQVWVQGYTLGSWFLPFLWLGLYMFLELQVTKLKKIYYTKIPINPRTQPSFQVENGVPKRSGSWGRRSFTCLIKMKTRKPRCSRILRRGMSTRQTLALATPSVRWYFSDFPSTTALLTRTDLQDVSFYLISMKFVSNALDTAIYFIFGYWLLAGDGCLNWKNVSSSLLNLYVF